MTSKSEKDCINLYQVFRGCKKAYHWADTIDYALDRRNASVLSGLSLPCSFTNAEECLMNLNFRVHLRVFFQIQTYYIQRKPMCNVKLKLRTCFGKYLSHAWLYQSPVCYQWVLDGVQLIMPPYTYIVSAFVSHELGQLLPRQSTCAMSCYPCWCLCGSWHLKSMHLSSF